jgi:pimeloyl-ACP methyl ester carboxylesterase
LERFYNQTLSWGGCSSFATTPDDTKAYANPNLQCAHLTVPLDYTNPNDREITIGLLRRPASDPANRIGSLVINPGGPGLSGMSWAATRLVDHIENNDIGRRFDLVGFDPRGVGFSEPRVVCLTPAERDAERQMNLGVDTSPTGVEKTEKREKDYNDKCLSRTGRDVLAHIGTRDVVRDLDIMRSALKDKKLTYLGYSYGTRLGAIYAEVFPTNVRAMILDGGLDLAQDPNSWNIDQGRGFQKAFDAFVEWCVARPDCGVGTDKDRAIVRYQELVRPLINQPIAVPDGRKLSYTDATIGTTQALYSPTLWPELNKGLQELNRNHAEALMRLSDESYGRERDGSYSTVVDVWRSVLCVDNPPTKDPNVARDVDAQYRNVAPFLDSGQPPSPALDYCAFWPVGPTGKPHHPRSPGLPTVMVIATTQDPIAPYQGGVKLANDLEARLLTNEDTQSTAFLQGNGCVDRIGVSYLTTLQLPAERTRCQEAR